MKSLKITYKPDMLKMFENMGITEVWLVLDHVVGFIVGTSKDGTPWVRYALPNQPVDMDDLPITEPDEIETFLSYFGALS